MRQSAIAALMQMTHALSRNPSSAVGAAASVRCLQQSSSSLACARYHAASGISARSGLQQAAWSAASGRSMSVAARAAGAVASPPQAAEEAEAYDLIQETEWRRDLSNTITLIGHLGADPVRKVLPSGVPVVNMNVAYKAPPSPAGGERPAEWHKVEVFGELADEAAAKLRKGQQIALHGKLRIVAWNDRETGQPRTSPKVIADQLAIVKPYSVPDTGPAAEQAPSPPHTTARYEPQYESVSAAPRNDQKGPADVKWETFFQDTNAWWDNRSTKTNLKQPDFKHKDDKSLALWLNGAPAWAVQQLVERGMAGSAASEVEPPF